MKKYFLNYWNQKNSPRVYVSVIKEKNEKCALKTLKKYGYQCTKKSIYNLDKKETYRNYKGKCKIIVSDPLNMKNKDERINYVYKNNMNHKIKYGYISSVLLWLYMAVFTLFRIYEVSVNKGKDRI